MPLFKSSPYALTFENSDATLEAIASIKSVFLFNVFFSLVFRVCLSLSMCNCQLIVEFAALSAVYCRLPYVHCVSFLCVLQW